MGVSEIKTLHLLHLGEKWIPLGSWVPCTPVILSTCEPVAMVAVRHLDITIGELQEDLDVQFMFTR